MLQVDHVRKEFGSVTAVRDVSFQIPAGATFGLIGPNGAGKTTTMRMVLGILTPDAGSITWKGARIDHAMRRTFGYLPEERGLYGKMKVREQIQYFGRLHGLVDPEISQRTNHWIADLELEAFAGRPCAELSKGNQQKVQIACAAVHQPKLLVLDEPFSGLDPVNAEMLLRIIKGLKAAGTTLVLSSHQMWQLEVLCDEFCIIANGGTVAHGTLADLRAGWPTRMVRVAPDTPAVRGVLERIAAGARVESRDGRIQVEVPTHTDYATLLRSLVAVDAVTEFETVEPSLHEIYLNAIGATVAA